MEWLLLIALASGFLWFIASLELPRNPAIKPSDKLLWMLMALTVAFIVSCASLIVLGVVELFGGR